jgi:hypothetical protein
MTTSMRIGDEKYSIRGIVQKNMFDSLQRAERGNLLNLW